MTELYRTPLHSKAERLIGEYLAGIVEGTFVHFPKTSAVNGLIVGNKGEARRFLEIKTRNCKREDYVTTILAQAKYITLRELTDRTEVPTSFAVVFTDCICILEVDDAMESYDKQIAGRRDRPNDGRAQEQCIMIPVDVMSMIPLPEGYSA